MASTFPVSEKPGEHMDYLHKHLLPWLFALLFLVAGYLLYGSAGHDDSHITFWASYTLLEHGEILNYNGERVEQSSSLLLTVLTALAAWLARVDVVTAGYLVAALGGALAVVMTVRSGGTIAALLLVSTPAFMLWNTSGMESTLAATCLLWFVLCWGEMLNQNSVPSPAAVLAAMLATALLMMVRPEMVTLCAGICFLYFIWKRFTRSRGRVAIIVFYATVLLVLSLLVAWRYAYFGSPLPLPVYAKVSPLSFFKLQMGFWYLLTHGVLNPVILVGMGCALFYILRSLRVDTATDNTILLASFALLAYCGFILLSGGDWMQAGRFLVPILPLAALIVADTLRSHRKTLYLATVVIIAISLYGHYDALKSRSHGIPVWASYYISPQHQQRYSVFEQYNQEHLRDMDVIDTLDRTITTLTEKQLAPITLMSGQSGMVFFYTAKQHFREVRFIDSRGLVEKTLLKCRQMDDIPRSSQGLYFDFDQFFARQPILESECGIGKPDILYDINDMTRELPQRMQAQAYTLIHKDGGKMVKPGSSLPTNTLPAANFVMVANDLMAALGNPQPVMIKYHEKPLIER